MTKTILKIPIRLHALCLDKEESVVDAMADFSRLPYVQKAEFRDIHFDIANLGETLTNAPLQGRNLILKKGVHLHWALPAALTHGTAPAAGTTLDYPAVPDRWLVTRIQADGTIDQWVVESDYLYPEGTTAGSVTYPVTPNTDQGESQRFRYLGRQMPLAHWLNNQANNTDEYLNQRAGEKLTAYGYEEPAFASFYPNCHSVFGFYDADITDPEAVKTCTYQVMGWYADEAHDFLQEQWAAVTAAMPAASAAEQYAQLCTQLNDDHGWVLPADSVRPERCVCYAQLQIADVTAAATATPSLTVAYTGGEALSAYLAQQLAPDDQDKVEAQLEAIHVLDRFSGQLLDVQAKFKEARHDHEFDSVPGHTIWTLRYGSAQDQEATLPEAIAHLLNQLNIAWQAYEHAQDQIADLQQQVYADWFKYMIAAYPEQGDYAGYPNVDLLKYYLTHEVIPALTKQQRETGTVTFNTTAEGTTLAVGASGTGSLAYAVQQHLQALQIALQAYVADTLINPDTLAHVTMDGLTAAQLANYLTNAGYVTVTADGWQLTNAFLTLASADEMAVITDVTDADRELQKRAEIYQVLKKELRLTRVNGPRYWQAKEPVVLISGMAPSGAAQPPQTTATLEVQAVTGSEAFPTTAADIAALYGLLADMSAEDAGYQTLTNRPWNPFILEWLVDVYPSKPGRDYASDDWTYQPDFVQDNYNLAITNAEFTYSQHGFVRGVNRYSGRTYLTPYAQQELQTRLATYLGDEGHAVANLAAADIQALMDALAAEDQTFDNPVYTALCAYQLLLDTHVLSQSLGGFNNNLVMFKTTQALKVADVLGFADYQPFTDTLVQAAVAEARHHAPLLYNDFHPIRSGALSFGALRVVDSFGQVKDIPCDDIRTTEKLRSTQGPNHILLYPRITQPARLNFRWLSSEAEEVEMNSHPAYSPVCGWVLPNLLTNSLSFYDRTGQGLGYISDDVVWRQFPGNTDVVTVAHIENNHLRKLVEYLLSGDRTYFTSFLSTLENALENIDPEDFSHNKALSILMGRPLALTRASINLELKGMPAVDQSWHALRKDMARHTREQDDFTNVKFPIRLGEHSQLNDGLVGYWIEDNGDYGNVFYSLESDSAPTDSIMTHADGADMNLHQSIADPAMLVAMLVDVRGAVHATTGILPTKGLRIPAEHYTQALQRLEVNFLTAPFLTDDGSTRLHLPPEAGYQWSFLQKQRSQWHTVQAHAVVTRAQLQGALPALANGLWEQLLEKKWLTQSDAQQGTDEAGIVSKALRATLDTPYLEQSLTIAAYLDTLYISMPQASFYAMGRQVIQEGWLRLSKK